MDPVVAAECASGRHPAAIWFGKTKKRQRRAAQICRGSCPLLDACRTWAVHDLVLEVDVKVVAGGLTETQIREERRSRNIPYPQRPPAIVTRLTNPKIPLSLDELSARSVPAGLSMSHTLQGTRDR